MGAKKTCLISVVHLTAISSIYPFTCTLDSKKQYRQIKPSSISFLEPNDPLDVMFQLRATSKTSQRFYIDLNYNNFKSATEVLFEFQIIQ